MKVATLSAILFTVAATASAVDTNAHRLANRMSPLPPARRGSKTDSANKSKPSISNSCNTGDIHCCNQVQDARQVKTSSAIAKLLGLLGVDIRSLTGQVGSNCSPISAVGAAGNSCSQQPVCCSNNKFNGLIVFGCSPFNLNL